MRGFMLPETWLIDLEATARVALEHTKSLRVTRSQRHGYVYASLGLLAPKYELRNIFEYLIYYPSIECDLVEGRIDMVWALKRQLVVAIELDSSVRSKSWRKLLTIDAAHKVWIYYGKRSPISELQDTDVNQQIKFIWLQ
jgi:hypothetical protein